ncbi:hypothetical protein GCM10027059_22590 [Myceligenerans halotolerans]
MSLLEPYADAASGWLDPAMDHSTSLREALSRSRPRWSPEWDHRVERIRQPIVFPLLYAHRARITPIAFHQLIDAAQEAARMHSHVVLTSVPTGRGGPDPSAPSIVVRTAQAFTDVGLDVRPGPDLAATPPQTLLARLCSSRMTRRSVDLANILVAAAADASATTHVLLADGLAAGDQLRGFDLHAPLTRLCHPREPFAPPPAGAKRLPAGQDARWAAAFTLNLTETTSTYDSATLSARTGPLWHRLHREQLTGPRTPDTEASIRAHINGHERGDEVTIPLFGAPVVAPPSTALLDYAAVAGPMTLIVDDLTPALAYADHSPESLRKTYNSAAAARGGRSLFLSELPELAARLEDALATLTLGDLHRAVGPRSRRVRGHLTGYDALHLAVMGLACTARPGTTIALRAANLAQLRVLNGLSPITRTITCSGQGAIEDAHLSVPARWLTEGVLA